jgi:hypothetical protein
MNGISSQDAGKEVGTAPRSPGGRLARLRGNLRWRYFRHRHPAVAAIVASVRDRKLSYLDRDALLDLADAATRLERNGIQGVFVEAGCALGGSTAVLAAAKHPERLLKVYDAFGMIPPPGPRDGQDVHERYRRISSGEARGIRGGEYYGYQENLLEQVARNLAGLGYPPDRLRVHLVPGLYEEALVVDYPVALAHLDCDWYDSVRVCLERLAPHIVPGGIVVIDDYFRWSGCRTAVDEFLASPVGGAFQRQWRARLHLVRGSDR